ncbi:MAG: hypothetical protein ACNFW9_05165 [Candidatus Kerfeldbacteria bacterium]
MGNNPSKILFIKSKSFIFLIISILILILILGYLFIIINNNNYFSKEGVVLGNYKEIEEIKFPPNSTIEIKQEIYSRLDNLGKIIISLRTNKLIILDLKLKNKSDNQIIRQKSISTKLTNGGIEILEWIIDPISNSNNKDYILLISTLSSSDLIFYTVEPERYDGGSLIINNKINDDSRIIVDWEYYTANPLQIIYHYLPFYKPEIFNNAATYIILTILFFTLQTLITWEILNIFLNKNDEN